MIEDRKKYLPVRDSKSSNPSPLNMLEHLSLKMGKRKVRISTEQKVVDIVRSNTLSVCIRVGFMCLWGYLTLTGCMKNNGGLFLGTLSLPGRHRASGHLQPDQVAAESTRLTARCVQPPGTWATVVPRLPRHAQAW